MLFLMVLEADLLQAVSQRNQPAASAKIRTPRIRKSVRSSEKKMDQTLRQLGELLLGAVPTVILLGLLYILYTFLVHRPLTAVLAERRARTQGAMEKARADIASAEARTAEYEQRLREARQKVFKNQEARRQQATQSRTQAVNEARARAQQEVKQARAALEEDKRQAMSKLQSDAARLAGEIVRTVLRPVTAINPAGGQ
jgi:F-type H+-transporting ATPase subunit b